MCLVYIIIIIRRFLKLPLSMVYNRDCSKCSLPISIIIDQSEQEYIPARISV